MHMLFQEDENLCLLDDTRERSYFTTPLFLEKLICENGYSFDSSNPCCNNLDIMKYSELCFPINMNRSPWSLAVSFVGTREVCIMIQ